MHQTLLRLCNPQLPKEKRISIFWLVGLDPQYVVGGWNMNRNMLQINTCLRRGWFELGLQVKIFCVMKFIYLYG